MDGNERAVVAKRAVAAFILMPIVVLCVKVGGIPLALLGLAFVLTGLAEYARLVSGHIWGSSQLLMYIAGSLYIGFSYYGVRAALGTITFGLTAALLIYEVFVAKIEGATARISTFTLGAIYVGIPIAHLQLLRGLGGDIGLYGVLFVLLVTWSTDTFAYFVGLLAGRTRLSKISPSKSLEGAVGGLLGAFLMGFIFKGQLGLSVAEALLLSGVASLASQLGDLAESLLKRDAKVKDSGHIIPGHGGVLDRIDSILFSAPAVYWTLWLITR